MCEQLRGPDGYSCLRGPPTLCWGCYAGQEVDELCRFSSRLRIHKWSKSRPSEHARKASSEELIGCLV